MSHHDEQERGQQVVPSAVIPPTPSDPPPPPPPGPAPAPLDHLAEAKRILAGAEIFTNQGGNGWDMERLAAAQVHALVGLAEAIRAHKPVTVTLSRRTTDFGPPPPVPSFDPANPDEHR